MKKAIVIILCVILALSGGLIVYGAVTFGGSASFVAADLGELLPPEEPNAYAHELAEWIALYAEEKGLYTLSAATNPAKDPSVFAAETDGWYDVFGKADPSTNLAIRHTGADLAAYMLVAVAYNHNRAKQFRMASHIVTRASGKTSYSDNTRIRSYFKPTVLNRFDLSLAWTGSSFSSFATLRAAYNDQRIVSSGNLVQSYDAATGAYAYQLNKPTVEPRDGDPQETPFVTYNLLTLPLYLGGGDSSAETATARVDGSVIDGSTVVLTAPTDAKPFYTLSFSEDVTKAQIPENTENRLDASLGGKMSDITIRKADFEAEIWDCGLFRQMTARFEINAKIKGKQSDAVIEMNYSFYYDDYNCDVERLFSEGGWDQYLSEENRAFLNARKKTYPAETAA